MRKFARVLVALIFALGLCGLSSATAATKKKPAKTRPTTSTAKPSTTVAPAATPAPITTVAPVTGTINVSAAASLTASFQALAAAFEKANPQARVVLNFAGSSTLAAQIKNGSPVDVFASADTANMDRLVDAKLIDGPPLIFTRNKLMIAIGRGNPLLIRSLKDLAREEVFVGLGAVGVPVGDYARQIFDKAGVVVKPKTLESNVSAIVNKIAIRELDAGVVYVTDVAIDEYRIDGIEIPENLNVVAAYPIGIVASSKQKAAANAFVAFTRSEAAQAILKKYKFLPLP